MNERQSEIDSQHERSKAKFMRKVSMAKLTGRGKSKVHAETRSDADSAQAAEGIVAAPGDSAELGAILEAETEDAPPADAVIDMTAFTVHEPASPLFEDEDAEVAPPQPPVEPEAPVEEDAPVPPPPDDDDAPPPPPPGD